MPPDTQSLIASFGDISNYLNPLPIILIVAVIVGLTLAPRNEGADPILHFFGFIVKTIGIGLIVLVVALVISGSSVYFRLGA